MGQLTIRFPDSLEREMKQEIGRMAAESGELPTKSEWLRDAAREKLGKTGEFEIEDFGEINAENEGTA